MNPHLQQLAELKKKKAPPVPKFESTQESKTLLREKMGELYSKLGATLSNDDKPTDTAVANIQSAPPQILPTAKAPEPDKKKLNLSNINEKLASMMNLKKDLLKPKTEPKEKKEEPKS